jgi:hypothetical protein
LIEKVENVRFESDSQAIADWKIAMNVDIQLAERKTPEKVPTPIALPGTGGRA